MSNTNCTIPLNVLTTEPFNLKLGDSVNVKLTATNDYGESPESTTGSGALIVLVPYPPI